MGMFKDILKDNESLFVDEIVLDPEHIPKLIPHREQQQKYIAECIKPLFQGRSGRNLFIHGLPGIGKTVAVKNIFVELIEESDEIIPIYINCWKKDTSFKVASEICDQINYKWVHNKRTDELMKIITEMLNKKSVVFCLDEIDKAKELDILYSMLTDINRKTILLITNEGNFLANLDNRIKSRLNADSVEFKPYNLNETKDILKERVKYAFVRDAFDEDAFNLIVDETFKAKDIRFGLHLLKEGGNSAEMMSSKKIKLEHVKRAIEGSKGVRIKNSLDLDDKEQDILKIVKENSDKSIKELYEIYQKIGGDKSYSTFYKTIDALKKKGMVETEEVYAQFGGKSLKVSYNKKLSDF